MADMKKYGLNAEKLEQVSGGTGSSGDRPGTDSFEVNARYEVHYRDDRSVCSVFKGTFVGKAGFITAPDSYVAVFKDIEPVEGFAPRNDRVHTGNIIQYRRIG